MHNSIFGYHRSFDAHYFVKSQSSRGKNYYNSTISVDYEFVSFSATASCSYTSWDREGKKHYSWIPFFFLFHVHRCLGPKLKVSTILTCLSASHLFILSGDFWAASCGYHVCRTCRKLWGKVLKLILSFALFLIHCSKKKQIVISKKNKVETNCYPWWWFASHWMLQDGIWWFAQNWDLHMGFFLSSW